MGLGQTSAVACQGSPKVLLRDGDGGLQLQNASLDQLEATKLLQGGAGEVGNGSRPFCPPFCFAVYLDI